jgi:hypothetical protein
MTRRTTAEAPEDVIVVVVFGMPGAGKSSVADAAFQILEEEGFPSSVGVVDEGYSPPPSFDCLKLDLDVCVPQWMRDNFAEGIYPNIHERRVFGQSCCAYVKESLTTNWNNNTTKTKHLPTASITIVSFSFVNADLREIFRKEFPNSHWILIDTTEEEAQRRIEQRKRHFYKGKKNNNHNDSSSIAKEEEEPKNAIKLDNTDKDLDNNDWNFAPVLFPYTKLNGLDPIGVNARKVAQIIAQHVSGR